MGRYLVLTLTVCLGMFAQVSDAWAKKCLFLSSYHQGYAWADGIERGVKSVLEGKCEIRQINMDTKRNHSLAYLQKTGLEVKAVIEAWQPDVVIAADDNASKYVVMPYFKDSDIPFVFCGINWSVREYGYPYSNVTGMIEVDPILSIFKAIQETVSRPKQGVYIGANTLTEHKSFARFKRTAEQRGYQLLPRFADSQDEWNQAFIDAQASDFIILGTKSGVVDWQDDVAYQVVSKHGGKTSITNYEWMTKFALMGMTKVPEEHGEWAAEAALEILKGTPPSQIPIIPSRRWDMYVNYDLMQIYDIEVPQSIMDKSKKAYGVE